MGIYRAKSVGRGAPKTSINKMGLSRTKLRSTYPENWDEIRQEVFERDGWKCRRCNTSLRGQFSRQVHHILPLSRGGSNKKFNLISLCGDCHCKQHKHM